MLKHPLTKKEYDILLYLRKKERTCRQITRKVPPKSQKQWNIWLSDLSPLYYVEPENGHLVDPETKVHLNDIGITVAQAEYDRRFDMYFNRIIALLALILSIVAIIVPLIG